MSPQKVADAVHSAPFLTHVVSHHGQVTLIPPENAGRMRQVRPKKSQGRTDRNARSEEEIRFNIGPRSPRTGVRGRRPARQPAHQERANEDRGYSRNSDIPDYPPPSFLEAISTPPLSVCPSTTTLANDPQSIAHSFSGIPEDSSRPFTPPSSAELSSNEPPLSRSNSETDSEEFVEVAERSSPHATDGQDQFREQVETDWMRRRGVEFPKPASPLLETCTPREPVHAEPLNRGRSRSRGGFDPDDEEDCPTAIPVTPPKRRHLSLSPLRTLFPSRPFMLQDRALSAHPSPKNSPYSLSHSSMSFFKSTTSLRLPSMSTSSFLKLPTTPPSSAASSIKLDGTSPRRLFPLKGKEKARASPDESWEVIESMDDDFPPFDSGKSSPPNRGQGYSYNPKASYSSSEKKPPSTPPHPPPTTSQPPESPSHHVPVHPLSLRDRKIPFVNRPVRRSPPTPRPPPPEPPVPVAGTGPPVVTVRTRKGKAPPPPPPKRTTQSITSSPLGAESWKADDAAEARSMVIYQRALETPLPLTPVDTVHFDLTRIVGGAPSSFSPRNSTARPRMDLISEETPDPRPPIPADLDDVFSSPREARLPVTNSSSSEDIFGRHHYPGRPLPRPPGPSRTAVDSTYAGYGDLQLGSPLENQCPEGLLINLDEPAEEPTRASTPQPDAFVPQGLVQHAYQSQQQTASVASSTNGSSHNMSNESLTSGRTSPIGFSNVTELDVLASHVADGHSDGTNYDNLLLLSEFLGPAARTQGDHDETRETPSPETTNPRPSLLGRIEVERRRTTKDGRNKLKLLLLDVTVDKCGICLFQFKSGELAAMSAVCRHAFHENCLERWTADKKSCPLCRGPL